MLILGGISGAGMTAVVEEFRPALLVVTFGFLGLAFYLTYRRAAAAPSRIVLINKILLWTVTVLAVVLLFFPQYVTELVLGGEEFTADMKRTVLTVEGMTCPG